METDSNIEPTERDKFIEEREAKIKRAAKAKRFVEGEDGSLVVDLLKEQINTSTRKVAGKGFLDDHQGYVYEVAKLHQAMELLNKLQVEASRDTTKLRSEINAAKSELQ